jgi:protein TonB
MIVCSFFGHLLLLLLVKKNTHQPTISLPPHYLVDQVYTQQSSIIKNPKSKASKSPSLSKKVTQTAMASQIKNETKIKFPHYSPHPMYPENAKKLGAEGRVIIKVSSGKDGKIKDAFVYSSSTYSLLDEAALAVLKTWVVDPDQTFLVPITFVLNKK